MANSSPRMSTAELRRRLQAPTAVPVPAPPAIIPEPVAVSRPAAGLRLPPQPVARTAPAMIDTPIAGDATIPMADLADEESALMIAPPHPLGRGSSSSSRSGRPSSHPNIQLGDSPGGSALFGEKIGADNHDELREENEQLQILLDEMRQLLQEASDNEQKLRDQLANTDLDNEKYEAKIRALENELANKPKSREELEEWADELERESFKITQERRLMEEDRKQLREDEAALEKQMRDMEVQMARERAMLARQEQELRRLNAEIQHEFEAMNRGDSVLRDRLSVFQRKHADVLAGGTAEPAGASRAGFTQSPVAASATPTPTPKRNDTTGLLRKIFRAE